MLARIRETWTEPLVPRYYERLRGFELQDVLEAIAGLTVFCPALPAPGRFVAAVESVVANRRREANGDPLPMAAPTTPVDRLAGYRRAVEEAVEQECAGLQGEDYDMHAQAVRERYARLSPGIAAALGMEEVGAQI